MTNLVVKNASWIVTVDRDRRIIKDGAIAIADDRIVFVGKSADLPASLSKAAVIDAKNMLVLPGFVDTHVHNAQHLGRGLADNATFRSNCLSDYTAINRK